MIKDKIFGPNGVRFRGVPLYIMPEWANTTCIYMNTDHALDIKYRGIHVILHGDRWWQAMGMHICRNPSSYFIVIFALL